MELFETVESRQSVRKYETREIDRQDLKKILETVNAAPSAGNLQAYDVVLVTDQPTKDALTKGAYGQAFISQAPISLVFCANGARAAKYGKRGADLYAVQDATIAAAYCQLAATALGLATVWVGAFDTAQVAEAIKASDRVTPVAVIPIGYAAETPARTSRRTILDLVHDNRF